MGILPADLLRKDMAHLVGLLRCVHGVCGALTGGHDDRDAVFQEAELFEAFGEFERGWCPACELTYDFAAVRVEADVLFDGHGAGISGVGDAVSGEVERVPGEIGDDLDDGGVLEFVFWAWGEQAGHALFWVVEQGLGAGADAVRVDEGLVSLDVDENISGDVMSDFGDSVSATGVIGAGHADLDPELVTGVTDFGIGGSDDDLLSQIGGATGFDNPLDHGLAA